MTRRFLLWFLFPIICSACAGSSVRSIVLDQDSPQIDLAKGSDLTVHFNKEIPIESAIIKRLEMIFIESEDQVIRGTIITELVGECIDPIDGHYCVNKEVVGRIVEIELQDIERINVWKNRTEIKKGAAVSSGNFDPFTATELTVKAIILTTCILTLGIGCT